MKKILLPLLLLGLFFNTYAQQKEQISYYYQGKKIYYPVSYDRIVGGIQPQSSFEGLKNRIAACFLFPRIR